MAGAWSGITTATKAAHSGEALIDRTNRVRVAQEFIRRQIRNALALPYVVDKSTGETRTFEGDADVMRFVAPMPGYLSRGGPYLLEFRLGPGRGGRRLEFQHWLMGPDGPLEAEREPEVLLEGIAEAAFSVRTVDEQGGPGPWLERWERPNELPRLVRLELRFADPRRRWPTLVAVARLGMAPVPGGVPVPTPEGEP